jgi:hypothetical protein
MGKVFFSPLLVLLLFQLIELHFHYIHLYAIYLKHSDGQTCIYFYKVFEARN